MLQHYNGPYYAIGRPDQTRHPWLGTVPTAHGAKECYSKLLEFTAAGGAITLLQTLEDANTHLAKQCPDIQDKLRVFCVQEDATGIQMTML